MFQLYLEDFYSSSNATAFLRQVLITETQKMWFFNVSTLVRVLSVFTSFDFLQFKKLNVKADYKA
jgi:hypothetical protein